MKHLDFALKVPSLAIGAVCLFAVPASASSTVDTTSAFGIAAHFESAGVGTKVGPIGFVAHLNGSVFDKKGSVSKVNETAPFVSANPTPTVFLNASNISSEVSSVSIPDEDAQSTTGTTSVGHVSLMLNLNPLPPSTPSVEPQPYLQVTGKNFVSEANYTKYGSDPNKFSIGGNARMDNLKIFGSLVGGQTLTYSGTPARNTVLYDSPTVTITLNENLETGPVTCNPDCVFTPNTITAAAVVIDLHKADIDGHKVTGSIVIAQSKVDME